MTRRLLALTFAFASLALGTALGEEQKPVAPSPDGSIRLTAALGKGIGPKIKHMPEHRAFGWFTAKDRIEWQADVRDSGTYEVRLEWSVADKSAGNPFVFEIDGKQVAGKSAATGGWETYKRAFIGTVELSAGTHRAEFRAGGDFAGALLDLREVRLVPAPRMKLPSTGPRPNILWITCEDISPNLGCYGDRGADTPNLDRLAAEGVRYTQVFSVAGVCAPSRSALISGMYPTSLGSHHMRSTAVLPKSILPFPAYLRAAGYYCTNSAKTDYNFDAPAGTWDDSSRPAHWRDRPAGRPFFSVFNLNITHESFIRAPFDKLQHDPATANLPPFLPDTPIVRRDFARYHDLISEMDRQAGDLLKQLADDGLAEETIVFFFSDHGMGLPRAKQWIWDAGLRVPMIVRVPEKYRQLAPGAAGSTNDRLVSFVDFAPTILTLAGVPLPESLQGQAFLGEKLPAPRSYVYAAKDRMDERYDHQRAVHDGRFKYIRNYLPHVPYAPRLDYMELLPTMQEFRRLAREGTLSGPPAQFLRLEKPVEELFDTKGDPHEFTNIAGDPAHRATLERLRKAHFDWVLSTRDLGLLPEHELHRRAAGGAEYDLARRGAAVPFERILDAAQLVGTTDLSGMTRALADADPAVRFWAVQALVNHGVKAAPAVESLEKALADESPEVVIAAAEALCRIDRAAKAVPVLARYLTHESPWVRLAAANVLDRIGSHAKLAAAAIRKASADDSSENRYVRWALVEALQRLER